MPCASLWMYSVTKNTTGMKRPRITARNAANDTSRPIVPPSEEGGLRQRGYSSAELRDGGGGGGGDGGEACNAGSSAELRDGGGGGDGGEACDAGGAGGELHGAPTATTPASRLVDDCMTEDGSSIICAGATLEAASLLVVRSAGCTKAEAPATRDSAKTERSIVFGGVSPELDGDRSLDSAIDLAADSAGRSAVRELR